jgi:hypothetical protein
LPLTRRRYYSGGVLRSRQNAAGARRLLALAVLLLAGCRYSAQPPNGIQVCGPVGGKRCPDGFFCAQDARCWRAGSGPADGGAVTPIGGPFTGRSGSGLVADGARSRGARFGAVRTLVGPVGGAQQARSRRYRFVGGLVGATVVEGGGR